MGVSYCLCTIGVLLNNHEVVSGFLSVEEFVFDAKIQLNICKWNKTDRIFVAIFSYLNFSNFSVFVITDVLFRLFVLTICPHRTYHTRLESLITQLEAHILRIVWLLVFFYSFRNANK